MVPTHLSNHLIFNNLRTNNRRSFAILVAIPKCSKPCNIQACKAMFKTILHKDGVFTNLTKALNNSCSPVLPDLSLVLRAGLGNSSQDLEANGAAGRVNPNDGFNENIRL
jgi:hypothetical protein